MPHCPACRTPVPADSTKCGSCGAPYLEPDLGLLESRLTPEQEAAAPVPSWLSTTLGVVGVGGAAWGLLALGVSFRNTQLSASSVVISALFCVLFMFGGYAGVLAIRRSRGWLHFTTLFWLIQVPVLSSPVISYAFASGGFVTAWLQLYPPIHVGTNFFLGSTFTFNLFTSGVPFAIGVNVIALAVSFLLVRAHR